MKTIKLFILFQLCFIEMQAQEAKQNTTLAQSNLVEVSKTNMSLAIKHYDKATKISTKGDKTAAILEYKKAITLNPNYIGAYNDMAIAFLNLKDYDSATYYFDMALSIQPAFKLAQKNKSVVFFVQGTDKLNAGDNQGSIPFYQEAINNNPNYQEAYNDMAIAYIRLEKYDLALENLDIALTINPEFKLAQNNKVYVYRKQGTKKRNEEDYQGAITAYQEAININSSFFEVYNDMAIVFMKLDNDKIAMMLLDKALSINPYYELARENKAIIYLKRGTNKLESGDNQGALSDFIESIDSYPFCEEAYTKIAIAFMNLGNLNNSQINSKKALEIKEEIVKRNEAKVYYSEGTKKYGSQNYKDAIQDYTKAVSIYPKYFEAYNDRGSAYYNLREFNTAMDDYKMCLQINPNYSVAQNNIKLIQQYRKDKLAFVVNIVTASAIMLTTAINTINNSSPGANAPSSSPIDYNKKNNQINEYLENKANNTVEREKKNSEYYYNYYRNLAEKEQTEADYYYKEYSSTKDIETLKRANSCSSRVKDYREKSEIYK